jgi:predicted nuclease of predicted toxin-antitoxin system
MRWLLDQGVPRSAASHLHDASHDAIHVGDIGMAAATDTAILAHAGIEQRIIVTFDADFHALLAASQASQPSVIRIREEGLKGDMVAKLLLHIVDRFPTELRNGCVMSCQGSKIRLRKLPIS